MTYTRDPNEIARDYARQQEQGAKVSTPPDVFGKRPRRGRVIGQWGTEVDGKEEHFIADNATVRPFGEHYVLVETEDEDGSALSYIVNLAKYRYVEFRVTNDEGE